MSNMLCGTGGYEGDEVQGFGDACIAALRWRGTPGAAAQIAVLNGKGRLLADQWASSHEVAAKLRHRSFWRHQTLLMRSLAMTAGSTDSHST